MATRKNASPQEAASKKSSRDPIASPAQDTESVLELFHPVTAAWFRAVFERPTAPQLQGWPAIARGESTLIFAPTGTGKTLTAFLWCIDRLMLRDAPPEEEACRVIYISPLKALAVDVERNLRSPSGRNHKHRAPRGRSRPPARDQRPHRRHVAERARTLQASSGRDTHHYARVPLSAAHL